VSQERVPQKPPGASGVDALIVGSIDRPDLLANFKRLQGRARLAFVDYRFNYGVELHPEHYRPYGQVVCWDEFRDAEALLNQIAPRRVAFFFYSSLTQIALKLVAQRRGIPTYHLEHGFRLRFDEYVNFEESRPAPSRWRALLRRSPRELSCSWKEHAFFWRSIPWIEPVKRRQLMTYAAGLYRGNRSPRLRRNFAEVRRVDEYVAYAPEDFLQRWQEDLLNVDNFQGVHFIGAPQFDHLCGLPADSVDPRNVILVDHMFHNAGIFGWTLDFRRAWTARIADIVRRLGLRLLIKLHPGDGSRAWDPYLSPGSIEVIDHDGLCRALPRTRLVLAGVSSMQLPLAAMGHTVLITLDIHPEAHQKPSAVFEQAGVGCAVTTFDELEAALRDAERLDAEQAPHKQRFREQFLGPMDGRAGDRLREILTTGSPSQMTRPRAAAEIVRSLLA
jgi:hypothetical protein